MCLTANFNISVTAVMLVLVFWGGSCQAVFWEAATDDDDEGKGRQGAQTPRIPVNKKNKP